MSISSPSSPSSLTSMIRLVVSLFSALLPKVGRFAKAEAAGPSAAMAAGRLRSKFSGAGDLAGLDETITDGSTA